MSVLGGSGPLALAYIAQEKTKATPKDGLCHTFSRHSQIADMVVQVQG